MANVPRSTMKIPGTRGWLITNELIQCGSIDLSLYDFIHAKRGDFRCLGFTSRYGTGNHLSIKSSATFSTSVGRLDLPSAPARPIEDIKKLFACPSIAAITISQHVCNDGIPPGGSKTFRSCRRCYTKSATWWPLQEEEKPLRTTLWSSLGA